MQNRILNNLFQRCKLHIHRNIFSMFCLNFEQNIHQDNSQNNLLLYQLNLKLHMYYRYNYNKPNYHILCSYLSNMQYTKKLMCQDPYKSKIHKNIGLYMYLQQNQKYILISNLYIWLMIECIVSMEKSSFYMIELNYLHTSSGDNYLNNYFGRKSMY